MQNESTRGMSTALGILAILIWSTSFAFGRSIMEQLGTFGGAACIYLLGGVLGCGMAALQGRLAGVQRMPRSYLVVCGGLFVAYIVTVQTGIGLARDRQQAVEVILLNYLWPGLTMALSVPIQRRRARWWLGPGVLLGIGGAMLGVASGRGISGWQMLDNLRTQPWPYVLGVAAALSWALYSNLSRRLAGDGQASGVPVFLLASGAAMGVLWLFASEPMHWGLRVELESAVRGAVPGLAGVPVLGGGDAPGADGPGGGHLVPDAAAGDDGDLLLPGRAAGGGAAGGLRPGGGRGGAV